MTVPVAGSSSFASGRLTPKSAAAPRPKSAPAICPSRPPALACTVFRSGREGARYDPEAQTASPIRFFLFRPVLPITTIAGGNVRAQRARSPSGRVETFVVGGGRDRLYDRARTWRPGPDGPAGGGVRTVDACPPRRRRRPVGSQVPRCRLRRRARRHRGRPAGRARGAGRGEGPRTA